MLGRTRVGRLLRDLNLLAALGVVAAGAALLLSPSSDDGLLGLPELKIGQEAPRTVKSPRAFAIADLETTERLREEASQLVLPTYDLRTNLGAEAKARVAEAFGADAELRGQDAGMNGERQQQRAQLFMRKLGVILEEEALTPLFRAADPTELRDATVMVLQNLYEARIVEDRALLKLQAPDGLQLRMIDSDGAASHEERVLDYDGLLGLDQARAHVDEVISAELKRLSVEQRRAVALISKALLAPNVEWNRAEDTRRIAEIRASVKTVVIPIKTGETVLRAGERVTERHLFILRGIERELRAQSRVQAAAGSAMLVVLMAALLALYLARAGAGLEPAPKDLTFLSTAYVLTLFLHWVGYKAVGWLGEVFPLGPPGAYRYLLPVAAGALLVRRVLRVEHAAAFALLSALLSGWMVGPSLGYAAFALAGCLAAGAAPRAGRSSLLRAAGRAGTAQVLAVVALALVESRFVVEETAAEAGAALLSGFISALIAALFLPAAEALFAYTTDERLEELSNLNHPLLRELLVEAPGTYHHSIMVGSLAEAGALAVHAHPPLARVGGYYHDIGKLKNPRGFEENSQPGLVSLSPAEEAREVKAHVPDGLELAAKHRLGLPIMDIIAQHHGTTAVRNAHRRLIELEPESARSGETVYGGPKPLTREAALVMLADVVEAATRELGNDPELDYPRIEAAVRRLVHEQVEARQLDGCALSLADLEAITVAFAGVLEERWLKRSRPAPSTVPRVATVQIVRPPAGGEPN